jgi:hypothetical protein
MISAQLEMESPTTLRLFRKHSTHSASRAVELSLYRLENI